MPAFRIANYELTERLGEGSGGTVYRATDGTGRHVAVKLLGAAELEPEAARARFAREVAILGALDHAALVTLLDHGVDDELGPYLVMPLVPGQTLRAAIGGAKLCPEAAILLLEPVAAAIAALHARDLIHRDVKPENAMIAPDGKVVVVDLGLAWGPAHSRHSVDGAAIGTVPYMAPEQIEGSGVGTAADVWALGVMLYELIAGKRPFARARASEEAAAALVGAYAPLDAVDARVPPELARLVAQSLDRAPGARPTAAAFAAELAAAIDWCEPADRNRERASIAIAPEAYLARVAPFRVRREKRLAREAIAGAKPFAALAHVDRALAYAPDDPELRALADEAEAKSGPVALPAGFSSEGELDEESGVRGWAEDGRGVTGSGMSGAGRGAAGSGRGGAERAGAGMSRRADARRAADGAATEVLSSSGARSIEAASPLDSDDGRGGRANGRDGQRGVRTIVLVAAGAAVAAAVAIGATVLAMRHRADDTHAAQTETPRDAGPSADAIVALPAPRDGGGDDDLPATDGGPPARTTAGPSPMPGLVLLAPSAIPNDLPNHLADMRAPPGENLVPQDRLEAATPAAAIADIDAQVAKDPDRTTRLGQAMVYVGAGKTTEGLAKLDKLLAEFPDFARGWAAKGYLEVRAGRAREADAALTKAIAIDPTSESLRNRGILRSHAGHARDAYPDLVEALHKDPNDVEAMAELAQIYSAAGHRDDARPLLERIVRLRPENATAWLDLSVTQPTMEALGSVRHALQVDPKSTRGRVRLCTVLDEAAEKEALTACEAAVQVAPGDAWAWMGRGLARYQIGGDPKGLDDLDKAIALRPDDAQFYINRYVLRSHAGRRTEAQDDLRTACKLGKSEACTALKKLGTSQ